MRDYFTLGASPAGENCAQLGSENFRELCSVEIAVFRAQMIRLCGEPPAFTTLQEKSFDHDFGRYYELAVCFEDSDEESVEYAYKLDENIPEFWDEEAKKELESLGYKLTGV